MIKLAQPRPLTLVRLAAGAALALGFCILPTVPTEAQAQDSQAPVPGLWQYDYHAFVFNAGNEMKCLSKNDVKRFFDGLCNKGSTCTYTTNDAHDGKVKLEGEWVDHKGRHTKVSANGVYDPKSFKLNAHIVLSFGLPVDGVIDGHFVSADCPPGMDKPKKAPKA
jgi:hypothetical protein